jgi:large subunit ribosomal protein L10
MPKQEKVEQVAALKEQVSRASALYFLDFTGVAVNDFNTTRRRLRETGASVKVVKNRLALRALTESGVDEAVGKFLRGPTSLVMAGEDSVAPARVIKEVARKLEKLGFKGAYLDSTFYGPEQFDFLASMPNKQELRAQLVGVLSAPMTELALSLERMISDLVYVFEQLGERKGQAPSEA